ncbi:N-myristoyl transferase [Peniophora sp. CONT]|nr:N-myristoyl transferase [Peniophora sp. CONT]
MPTIREVEDDEPLSDDQHSDDDVSSSEEPTAGPSEPTPSASASSKKKKKKRSKVAKMINKLKGNEVPQAVVEKVMEGVKKDGNAEAQNLDESQVRQILEQLKINDVLQGKAGLGGKNKKDAGDHKFWSTQPVTQFGEEVDEEGPLEPSQPHEKVKQDAYPLPKDFEWSTVDLTDAAELKEVYELLSANYVEDDQASFRFAYSPEFFQWALMPPGYHKEWHIGVRVKSNKKLVAFISGVPLKLRVRGNEFDSSEINYLCVHKKLRSKRLAPVLIKEVTRQCHLKGIFQAIYTAGVVIPTPISTCRYFHRTLNVPKLVDIKFTYVPRNMTLARMIKLYKVPAELKLASKGLREMEDRDVEAVHELFDRYMARFDMVPHMSVEEVRHQFVSGRGVGEVDGQTKRRERQVVWTYVVEHPETHKITDFFSFYSLPSTVINNPKHKLVEAAYLFYYASDVAFQEGADERGLLKHRLHDLIQDAIVVAEQAKFDVFNALTLMDNNAFLTDLKFGAGDGLLNFYLYNWKTKPLSGYNAVGDKPAGRGVGVVML